MRKIDNRGWVDKDHVWHQLAGGGLALALLLALTTADQGETASAPTGSSRQAALAECVTACKENCRSYTYDCWYGICTGCKWTCPFICRWRIRRSGRARVAANQRAPVARRRVAGPGPQPPPGPGPKGRAGRRRRRRRRKGRQRLRKAKRKG
ncbi:hypothetical protein RRG08_016702 [Elysia crispata]|uniref:Uncharacterized protein n=1 Tax=Elysia crispata TaxID=231223 RepID=A0AAE0ZQP4_9GAST|nr:hypothetical protein RRG08_016702 [Elysia crispata]